MFSELQALVALAEAGSMERAASNLHLTPSALTRRIQRLETELGTVLVDRHFKPLRLTATGNDVLHRSRTILLSVSDLKTSTAEQAIPSGSFRVGLSHALAQPEIAGVMIGWAKRFPLLRQSICNDVSRELLNSLETGKLDAALVVLPVASPLPSDLPGVTIYQEEMRLVEGRPLAGRKRSSPADFCRRSWVLNPAGCLVREELTHRVERMGGRLAIAAELHNLDLQLKLVAGNLGIGLVRASVLRKHFLRDRLSVITVPSFSITIRIGFLRGRHLGSRELAAIELQRMLVKHFSTNTSTSKTARQPTGHNSLA